MKPCRYCGRENEDNTISCRECGTALVDPSADTKPQEPRQSEIGSPIGIFRDLALDLKPRWLLCSLGLAVLAVALALFLSRHGPKASAPRIVVIATWYSNGEQLVTFRLDPPSAKLTYSDLVSGSYDANAQPPTVRSFGHIFPVRNEKETNYTLHVVALPWPGASFAGKPVPYTPGTYTAAYTPTESANRLRVGVAFEHKGIGDYVRRLRNCCEQKTLALLWLKSLRDPVFVTTEAITNAASRTR
jgi:hypothetical protein